MRRNNHTNRIEKTSRQKKTYKNKHETVEANNSNSIRVEKKQKNGVLINTAKSHFLKTTIVKHGRRAKTDF